MDTFLKLTSTPQNKQCNCITPFFLADLEKGINQNTGRRYTQEDITSIRASVMRLSNARGCTVTSCCDPRADFSNIDPQFLNSVSSKFSHYQLNNKNGVLDSISLWDKDAAGKTLSPDSTWKPMEPYIVCKISKAEIRESPEAAHIKIASKLVNDCFINNCDNTETLTLQNVISGTSADMNSTYIDDMKVSSAIKDGDMVYLKEYIQTYGMVDQALTYDDENNRILHLVAQYGTPAMMDLILALKPNLDITNVDGNTPLHLAALGGQTDAVEKLLGQGASPNLPNINHEFAINMAVRSGKFEIVRMLYSSGASLLYYDKNGNNLLHYTVLYAPENDDKVSLMNFLLEHGLHSEEKNKQGKTPLQLTKIRLNKLDKSDYLTKYLTGNETKKPTGAARYVVLNDDDDYIGTEGFNDMQSTLVSSLTPSWWSNLTSYFGTGAGSATELPQATVPTNVPTNVITDKNNNIATPTLLNKSAKVRVKYDKDGLLVENNDPILIEAENQQPNIKPVSQEVSNLLQIQTMLFNNIIANNPEKYQNKYFNIKDLPKGAPVQGIYKQCVGPNVRGDEDNIECQAKGGRIANVKNATTRIKLEMVDAKNMSKVEAIKDDDLMRPKYYTPTPDEYNIPIAAINPAPSTSTSLIEKMGETHPPVMDDNMVAQSANEAHNNSSKIMEGFSSNTSSNSNHSNPSNLFSYRNLLILLIIVIIGIIIALILL